MSRSGTNPLLTADDARVTVDLDDGRVCWTIRDGDGEILAQTRLSNDQAIHFGTLLLNAAVQNR